MMDPIQRAVANPPRKIVMQCAARRKVFWNIAPLAAGAQDVHHAVHDGPHFGPPLTAPTSGGRNQRLDTCPFVISQVARISKVIAVVLRPVLVRPQCKPLLESGWAPSNPSDSKESRSLRTDTQVLTRIPMGVAYAIWSGAGIALTCVAGWLFFRQPLTTMQVLCIGLVVVGAIGLSLSTNPA